MFFERGKEFIGRAEEFTLIVYVALVLELVSRTGRCGYLVVKSELNDANCLNFLGDDAHASDEIDGGAYRIADWNFDVHCGGVWASQVRLALVKHKEEEEATADVGGRLGVLWWCGRCVVLPLLKHCVPLLFRELFSCKGKVVVPRLPFLGVGDRLFHTIFLSLCKAN